jgi:hypothetical protein
MVQIFLRLNVKLKTLDLPATGRAHVEYHYEPANASLRSAAGASGRGAKFRRMRQAILVVR